MDSASTLKILLQVQADVADLKGKLNPALAETKTQLSEVSAAGQSAAVAGGELAGALSGLIGGAALGAVGALTFAFSQIPGAVLQALDEIVRMNEEMIKQTNETAAAVREWERLSSVADKFADQVKLSERIATDLEKAAAEYAAWRSKELGFWATFIDTIASQWATIPGFGARPISEAADAATAAARNNLILQIQDQAGATEKAARAIAEWKDQQKNLSTGIPEVEARVKGLTTAIDEQNLIISKVANKGLTASDLELHDAEGAVVERARLNEQLQLAQGHLKTLNDEQDKLNKSTAGEREAHRDIAALLSQQRVELEGIRLASQSGEQNPFLRLGDKDALNLHLIPKEIATINAQIAQNRAAISKSIFDPSETNRAVSIIKQGTAAVGQLQTKLQLAGSQTKQFQASLVAWANSFGSVGTQLAQGLQNTVGTAINGISNAITGLIFKTTSWGQAFAQVGQAIVGQIVQIFVQLIASQIISYIVGATIAQAAQKAASKQAASLAASWAVPATLASIATEGGASIAGDAALKLSLLTNIALATGLAAGGAGGGFAKGGYTGEGDPNQVAGFAHRGEFIFSAPATRAYGRATLEAAHANFSRPSYQTGGFVGPSSASLGGKSSVGKTVINQALFLDIRKAQKWLQNRDGEKYIVDIVNSRGGTLRA
jgi:hypothetical protein